MYHVICTSILCMWSLIHMASYSQVLPAVQQIYSFHFQYYMYSTSLLYYFLYNYYGAFLDYNYKVLCNYTYFSPYRMLCVENVVIVLPVVCSQSFIFCFWQQFCHGVCTRGANFTCVAIQPQSAKEKKKKQLVLLVLLVCSLGYTCYTYM